MEETRKHVHVEKGENEAKFWLEPSIELARNYGFSSKEISYILHIIHENEQVINNKWNLHFHSKQVR